MARESDGPHLESFRQIIIHPRLWAATVLAVMSWPLMAAASNVSGTYIAKFSNAVEMLQIVETRDHQLTGQMQTVVHTGNGKVESVSYVVAGAIDGSNVSLFLKGTFLLSEPVTAFGKFTASKLTLTGKLAGSQPSTLEFVRSDAQEFDALVKLVNEQAQRFAAAKAEAEAREKAAMRERKFVMGLNSLAGRMTTFDDAVNAIVAKLPLAEQRYRTITTKMNQYLQKQRSFVGVPNADAARNELSVTVQQGTIPTDAMHSEVLQAQWDFDTKAQPLMKQVVASEHECRADTNASDDGQGEERRAVCVKFQSGVPRFKHQFVALAKALAHAEKVYQNERAIQVRLANEAAHIE